MFDSQRPGHDEDDQGEAEAEGDQAGDQELHKKETVQRKARLEQLGLSLQILSLIWLLRLKSEVEAVTHSPS